MDHLVGNRGHRLSGKRLLAGRHPVKDYAEGEQVRSPVNERASKLLRRRQTPASPAFCPGVVICPPLVSRLQSP